MSKVNYFGIDVEDVKDCVEKEENFYSQAHQDLFVLGIHKYKKNGTFVDIGCATPRENNNTFLLEKNGWTGLNFDILNYKHLWEKHRTTNFLHCDATQVEYKDIFDKTFQTKNIDYLSLDIDTASNIVLKKLPFNEYKFNIITIEHDLYARQSIYRQKGYTKQTVPDLDPYEIKQQQHNILKENGYVCLIENVSVFEKTGIYPFEDWWVSPTLFQTLKKQLNNIHSDEILNFYGILTSRDFLLEAKNLQEISPENILKSLASDYLDKNKQYLNLTKKPKLIYVPITWLTTFYKKIVPLIDYNFSIITYNIENNVFPDDILNCPKTDFYYFVNGKKNEHPKVKTPSFNNIFAKLV